jgi:2-amino-4-hydroxy-6-hydroxymethyldihydropteridine diphosphokinase
MFLNGAVALETSLSARDLLALLLAVERELGRVRAERWGPRTVDLDLLVYGDDVVDEPGLRVPHPRVRERRFALEPLAELDPDLAIPGLGRVSDALAALD